MELNVIELEEDPGILHFMFREEELCSVTADEAIDFAWRIIGIAKEGIRTKK